METPKKGEKVKAFNMSGILKKTAYSVLVGSALIGSLPGTTGLPGMGVPLAQAGASAYTYEQETVDGVVWNLVRTAEDLDHMRDDKEGDYKLAANISRQELETYLNGKYGSIYWQPIGKKGDEFFGRFDGNNHTIDGLSVTDRSGGLFGHLYKAEVRSLKLTDLTILSMQSTGGLATYAYASDIFGVSVEGSVQGSYYVGGLVGEVEGSNIEQSSFRGNVQAFRNAGGLIGYAGFDAEYGMSQIKDNYVWGEVSQRNPARLAPNEVSIANIDKSRYAGFVSTVRVTGLDLAPEAEPIFVNNYASVTLGAPDSQNEYLEGWSFAGAEPDQEFIPSASNYWNTRSNDGAPTMVLSAQALNDQETKTQSNFKGWDFEKVWTMDPVSGYPIHRTSESQQPTNPTNPTNPTTPTIPSNPSTDGGTSTPVVNTPAPTNTTTINVNVQSNTATNGAVVASLAITRTKGTDGTVKDQLQLTPTKAKEIIDLLKTSGSKTAAIVLPDTNDEVSEWNVSVPKDASSVLTGEGIELVILNPNVRISVPASSLNGLTDDLYFRLIPVKSTATSTEIQQRALGNAEIVKTANGGDITVLGRPMTIETNLQSRPVTLTLPLPVNSTFTAAQQQKLGVYIEHSDGTKQLVRGKVVTLEDGKLGLEISVNHFSTFTIVNVSKWGGTLNAAPYIMGYADGSFKPAQDITRAELAAIVSRITGVTEGSASFSDVKNGSWASTVVGPAAASGIMTGYSDGTFKPNASITRGELAAALAKLLPQSGLSATASAAGFGDLSGHWAASAAAELQAAGVVTGYADGSFKPEQAVTRAEAVTMINRLIGLDASMAIPGASEWSDVASGYWAHDAIRAASMTR